MDTGHGGKGGRECSLGTFAGDVLTPILPGTFPWERSSPYPGNVCGGTFPIPCIPCWEGCTEPVSPPPTPFLPNAVTDSPGRGWGTLVPGNRTVTQCVLECLFPKGEMLSVFFILCFLCLVRCLLSFFAVLLF